MISVNLCVIVHSPKGVAILEGCHHFLPPIK